MSQVNASVCMGMGKIGHKRLKLYRERIKARGYKSLSKYMVETMDRELGLDFSPESHRQSPERIPQEV